MIVCRRQQWNNRFQGRFYRVTTLTILTKPYSYLLSFSLHLQHIHTQHSCNLTRSYTSISTHKLRISIFPECFVILHLALRRPSRIKKILETRSEFLYTQDCRIWEETFSSGENTQRNRIQRA